MEKIEIDMIHNIEELAELQKELTKYLRGDLRIKKLIEEIKDVEIAIANIKEHFRLGLTNCPKCNNFVLIEKNKDHGVCDSCGKIFYHKKGK